MIRYRWVLKNLTRNRRRTLLTLASVTASMFLLSLLVAAYGFLRSPADPDHTHLLLVVSPRASMAMPMPVSYTKQIAALPGVAAVSPFSYFAGHYGGGDALIPALAFDAGSVFLFFGDWKVPEDEKQAFLRERTALIVGRKLAQRYAWKIGEPIHLTSSMYSGLSLEFVIRGIYTAREDETVALFHWDYLNEALGRRNTASQFWLLAQSPADVPRLMQAIDATFRDAPVETRTGTLKQVMLDFLNLLGNVQAILVSISAAVLFAVLMVVANAMAMSVRERIPEFATLRALGFRRVHILSWLAAECLSISLAGAVLGWLAASEVARLASRFAVGGAMPARLVVGGPALGLLGLVAIFISLASSLVPAYRAWKLSISEALRFLP